MIIGCMCAALLNTDDHPVIQLREALLYLSSLFVFNTSTILESQEMSDFCSESIFYQPSCHLGQDSLWYERATCFPCLVSELPWRWFQMLLCLSPVLHLCCSPTTFRICLSNKVSWLSEILAILA